MNFYQKLSQTVSSHMGLCIGLDPTLDKLPIKFHACSQPLLDFNLEIIRATAPYASAYKPNFAFYEVYGEKGWNQLAETIKAIPEGKIVIADAKRGDIGNTAKSYAESIFSGLHADAATVSPYLGSDSLIPFLNDASHGAFILAVTSNPSGVEFQDLIVDDKPLYIKVIELARKINHNKNVGLVVGATKPTVWQDVIKYAVDLPLLVPGIGAQGGDLNSLKLALKGYSAPILINASRSILFASSGDDFAKAAAQEAQTLLSQIES